MKNEFLQQPLDKQILFRYNNTRLVNGRLAQLVEHSLDVRRVSGSSPLTSTTKKTALSIRQSGLF